MPTFSEYVAQSNRGMMTRLVPAGFFAKQTYLQQANIFTSTFGKIVWDALNNQTKFWNVLEKVPFGPVVGWRVRSARVTDTTAGRSSRPITEVGTIPTVGRSTYQTVSSNPRIIGTTFGASVTAQFLGGLEGGIGDALAQEQTAAARDHVKEMQQELLLGSHTIIQTGGASATGAIAQDIFRIGDTFRTAGANGGEGTDTDQILTAIGAVDPFVLTFTGGETLADGEIIYVVSRAGLTSIDDIIEEDARTVAGEAMTVPGNRGPGVYSITGAAARTANTWNSGAIILDNNGTARNITLALLDQAIREIRFNGGDPDLILTNYDEYDRISALLQPQQRFIAEGDFVVKLGDEQTLPGYRTGLQVATYKGIPVLPDADVRFGVNANDTDQGSYVYVLDTRHLKMAIAHATNYMENRDFFAANAMVVRGLFWSMAELRASRFDVNSKICDLLA